MFEINKTNAGKDETTPVLVDLCGLEGCIIGQPKVAHIGTEE